MFQLQPYQKIDDSDQKNDVVYKHLFFNRCNTWHGEIIYFSNFDLIILSQKTLEESFQSYKSIKWFVLLIGLLYIYFDYQHLYKTEERQKEGF